MTDPQKIFLRGKHSDKFVLVDAEDFACLNQWKWSYHVNGAVRNKKIKGKSNLIFMQYELLKPIQDMYIDHRNMNNLDNRKENLRYCNKAQNSMNRRLQANNTSGLRGVSWNKSLKKWHAYIKVSGNRITLGYFLNKIEAGTEYNKAATKYFKEFARLNSLEGGIL